MFFRKLFYPVGAVRDILAGVFGSFGVHPHAITLAALPLAALTAWQFYEGNILIAGLLLIATGACDLVDGALARNFKWDSEFGAFLDWTVDSYADLIIFAGISLYFMRTGSLTMTLFALSAMIGTVMFEYARSRAENIVGSCKVGLLKRTERFVLLILGSLAGQLVLVTVFLGIFMHVDALRRAAHTAIQLKKSREI